MTKYMIIPDGSASTFSIGIESPNGARQTLLGFASQAEAEAWIAQDEALPGLIDGPDRHETGPFAGG